MRGSVCMAKEGVNTKFRAFQDVIHDEAAPHCCQYSRNFPTYCTAPGNVVR